MIKKLILLYIFIEMTRIKCYTENKNRIRAMSIMSNDQTNNKKRVSSGISLRGLLVFMTVIALLMAILIAFSIFHLTSTFRHLENATDEYISLEKAANELMDASDYLTENAQRFTIDGDKRYLNAYFTEAFETKRREAAVDTLSKNPDCKDALVDLKAAMTDSKELMEREYYSMKLVAMAKGYTDCPDVVNAVKLNPDDEALSADDKMRRASEMVLGEEYYQKKDQIRENMKGSLSDIELLTDSRKKAAEDELRLSLLVIGLIIILLVIGECGLVFFISRIGITPVLNAVAQIKDSGMITEEGTNEFRALAQEYNKMYAQYKSGVNRLNYDSSHDQLTKVYNRTGYDLLLSGIDMQSTYLIVLDIDDFKSVNDNYGHETGDKVLKKVARILLNHFRSDDYVCRIGGDEFVVFMVHSDNILEYLITNKIEHINSVLADTADGLPAVSVSAGVSHGTNAGDTSELFNQADKAMYIIKRKGKKGCAFYTA